MLNIKELTKLLKTYKIYHAPKSLIWYFSCYVFKDIDIQNKSFLDIGGGIGLASFYSIYCGAREAILLEPEDAGSGSFKMQNFNLLKEKSKAHTNRLSLVKELFQNFIALENSFDIILLHNSINHLDEEACSKLHIDKISQEIYLKLFEKLYSLLRVGGKIVLLDCSRTNFFNDLGLKNPISPSIEWNKHQNPEMWISLMEKVGFKYFNIQWSSLKQLRGFGRILFGNKLMAYLTYSHFKLGATK